MARIRSFIEKLSQPKGGVTLERAEELYSKARHADAAVLFRTLAEQNDVQAQWRLGQLYERGEGVLQSFVEAANWFQRAAQRARCRRWRGSGSTT